MNAPRVTVLMAVYNGAAYLSEAIDSVLAQTFPDFELLIVDDASTDDTVPIVESYRDPRIRLVRNEANLNQVASLNRGLGEARGAYIARLDHDDLCRPERLARQVGVLDARREVGVVGTYMDVRDNAGRRQALLGHPIDGYADFLYALFTDKPVLGHPSVLLRLGAVEEVGGYDVSMRWAEDKDLWARLALAGYEAAVLREPLVVYRYHEAQQSTTQHDRQLAAAARAVERLLSELAGPEHARAARLSLSRFSADFWASGVAPDAPPALDALLAGARARLPLTEHEGRRLELLVAHHVERLARRGWKSGVAAQRVDSRPLWEWASSRTGRRTAPLYAAVTVAAPALYRGRRLRISVTSAVQDSPRTARLKALGRRSQRLTRLYRRVVSDR